jgi:hypothetical protein
MLSKIFEKIIFAVFLIYWGFNILLISPTNLLNYKIKNSEINKKFLNQNWSFFAPPPKYNSRIYYTFYDKNMQMMKTFEILEEISKKKRLQAPFNWNEQALDYCLQSSVIEIYIILNYQEPTDYKNRYEIVKNSAGFNTLYNYSKKINQKLDYKFSYVEISITEVQIPKIGKFSESRNWKELRLLKSEVIKL